MAPVIFTSSEPFGTGHSLYTVLPSIEKETKGPSTVTNKEFIYTGHGRGSSIACWTALDLDKANKRQDKTDFDRQWTRGKANAKVDVKAQSDSIQQVVSITVSNKVPPDSSRQTPKNNEQSYTYSSRGHCWWWTRKAKADASKSNCHYCSGTAAAAASSTTKIAKQEEQKQRSSS